jgi:hypothetical protein
VAKARQVWYCKQERAKYRVGTWKARTNSSGASLRDSVCQEVGIKTCRQSQHPRGPINRVCFCNDGFVDFWLMERVRTQSTGRAGRTIVNPDYFGERKARRRWWPSRDRRSLLPATSLSTNNVAAACSYAKAFKSRNSHRSRRTMPNKSRDVQAEREGSRCRGRVL